MEVEWRYVKETVEDIIYAKMFEIHKKIFKEKLEEEIIAKACDPQRRGYIGWIFSIDDLEYIPTI